MPTFAEIVGVEPPKDIHGISFLSTLKGDAMNQQKHRYLYFEFYEKGGKQAVVSENWKYIKLNVRRGEGAEDPVNELYNVESDPGEQFNIVEKNPEVAAKMEEFIKEGHTPFSVAALF